MIVALHRSIFCSKHNYLYLYPFRTPFQCVQYDQAASISTENRGSVRRTHPTSAEQRYNQIKVTISRHTALVAADAAEKNGVGLDYVSNSQQPASMQNTSNYRVGILYTLDKCCNEEPAIWNFQGLLSSFINLRIQS